MLLTYDLHALSGTRHADRPLYAIQHGSICTHRFLCPVFWDITNRYSVQLSANGPMLNRLYRSIRMTQTSLRACMCQKCKTKTYMKTPATAGTSGYSISGEKAS